MCWRCTFPWSSQKSIYLALPLSATKASAGTSQCQGKNASSPETNKKLASAAVQCYVWVLTISSESHIISISPSKWFMFVQLIQGTQSKSFCSQTSQLTILLEVLPFWWGSWLLWESQFDASSVVLLSCSCVWLTHYSFRKYTKIKLK